MRLVLVAPSSCLQQQHSGCPQSLDVDDLKIPMLDQIIGRRVTPIDRPDGPFLKMHAVHAVHLIVVGIPQRVRVPVVASTHTTTATLLIKTIIIHIYIVKTK